MKRVTGLTVFLLIFSLATQAQETKSDYEIQKDFQEQYNEIQNRADTVSSVDSAQAIIESIKELESNFEEHADLLNQALYPNTFDEEIEQLRKSSTRTLNRVEERQKRTEKLDELQTQLSTYEDDLEQLNSRTDSLNQAMQESIESEKQLSSMVRNYRNSLEERDELILGFIDSMVVAYQQMDLQSLQNLEDMEEESRLGSDRDVLQMIHAITMENMQILEENSDKLRLEDYMRMGEVQQEFTGMWNSLGNKITEVYQGDNSEQLNSEIDQNLNQWNQSLKDQTYSTLSDTLQAQNIQAENFNSDDQFFNSLNSYLSDQIAQSREDATEEGYNEYQQFQEFWDRVQMEWSSDFVDAGILTSEQMAELDSKVDTWGDHAQPASSNILVYLLGAAVIIALILGVLFIRERQNRA